MNYQDDKDKTILQYDAQGFIISQKRVNDQIATQMVDIKDILEKCLKEFNSRNQSKPKLNAFEQALLDAQVKPVDFADIFKEQANPMVQTAVILDRVAKSIEDLIDESIPQNNKSVSGTPGIQRRAIEIDSPEAVVREFSKQKRDANGRFVGDKDQAENNKSVVNKTAQMLGSAIKEVMPHSPNGVDPTVDAINEVATVLSPVKRVAGVMLRPLTGVMKNRKRNEPLPKEQSDHNRKQLKALQKIADNLQSKGGLFGAIGKLLGGGKGGLLGLAGGLLGGLLGKGGKGLTKLLKFGKGLPVVGALLTAMSFSRWDKKNTQEKGQTVGSAVGGLAGGALGTLFGPVGTIVGAGVGSWIGEKLGGVVAPYVKQWTDSLISADIPSMIKKAWDGFVDLVSNAFDATPAGAVVDGAKKVAKGGVNAFKTMKSVIGQALHDTFSGESEPVKRVAQFGDAAKSSKNTTDARSKALNFFMQKGWSKEQAAGIVANIETESSFNPKAVGDSGKALGLAQWHPDRQANFKKQFGKDLRNASLEEQLEFIHFEMTKGTEKPAGNKLKKAKTAREAGALVSKYYERPSAKELEASKRGNLAEQVLKNHVGNSNSNVKNTTLEQSMTSEINKNNIHNTTASTPTVTTQKAIKPMATRTQSLAASYTPPKLETKIEPIKEYLTSPDPQKVHVVNSNSGNISQNVSDRILAHAITGGLGMGDRWNG